MRKYICDTCGREVIAVDYYEYQVVQKQGDSVHLIDDDIIGVCVVCVEIVSERLKKMKSPLAGFEPAAPGRGELK